MQPKAMTALTGIILLLTVVDLGHINCPTCGGRGYVEPGKMFGMDELRIVRAETKTAEYLEVCGEVWGYIVTANITMVNEGSVTARGYIVVTFKDAETGKVLLKKLLPVQIPEGREGCVMMPNQLVITSLGGALPGFEMSADVPSGSDVTCPVCEAKGEVNILKGLILATPMGSRLTEIST